MANKDEVVAVFSNALEKDYLKKKIAKLQEQLDQTKCCGSCGNWDHQTDYQSSCKLNKPGKENRYNSCRHDWVPDPRIKLNKGN